MLHQLVMMSLLMNSNNGRRITNNAGIGSPSSYVYRHWYEPTKDSEDDIDNGVDVDKHDTNNHILSSVMDIFNNEIGDSVRDEDELLSSIYQDILNPVIKETVKRKKESNSVNAMPNNEYIDKNPANRVFSTMLTPKTQKRVGQGISRLLSSIPHYQALLQYVVYIIGGTIVMSLPALG